MTENNSNKKKFQIKSFNYKWCEFLIAYAILNIFIFYNIDANINSIYENFSKLFVTDFVVDGSDLSIFANMFVAPVFAILVIMSIGIILFEEVIMTLLFKLVYFTSMVKSEEMAKLYQNIKITVLFSILINIIGIMFWGDIKRTIIFVCFYLPLPLFTFIFICLKMRKSIKEEVLKI